MADGHWPLQRNVINHRRNQSFAIYRCYQSFIINWGPAVTFSAEDTVSCRIGAIPKPAAEPASFELSRHDITSMMSATTAMWTTLVAVLALALGSTVEDRKPSTVFVAILIRNKAHTLPYFFSALESLDYPKDRMHLW